MLDGDEWVLNGQKIWTSAGHLADHIFMLARTDPDAPKHKGISFLLVDMHQPGIEVRPIKMISGDSEFNEVFYTDATCPKDNVVGGVNNGWAVAMTLLGYERGEAAATVPIRFQAELDRLLALAKERGVADDPVIRQRLAWCYGKVADHALPRHARRSPSSSPATTRAPTAAISKLYWSEYHKVVTELAVDILGADALVPTGRRPSSAFQTDDAGAPNSSRRGSARSSTPGPARSTPARRRSSATSSARWSSACRRSRRSSGRGTVEPRARRGGGRAGPSAAVARPRCASGGAPRRRAGGGGGRSCRCRPATTCASGWSTQYGDGRSPRRAPPMCSTTCRGARTASER